MGEYALTDHVGVPDRVGQVTRLQNAAFAQYEGAMPVDERWTAWYLRRPGTEAGLCQAALAGDELVSQVLVCVQPLQLGGTTLRCGIIDSVATAPEHRRQGLARALMERAHEALREREVDAAVLYTNPDDHPYRFYRRLGYETRARGTMLVGRRPERPCAAERVDPAEHAAGLRELINDYHASWEGFAALDEDLWAWHRLQPPGEGPTVVAELTGSGPVSTASFASAPVRIEGEEHRMSVAYDLAAEVMNREQMASLVASAPLAVLGLLLDEDAPERGWADELGFEPRVSEVAMVLPFSREADVAMEQHGGPWYVMVESVVGV